MNKYTDRNCSIQNKWRNIAPVNSMLVYFFTISNPYPKKGILHSFFRYRVLLGIKRKLPFIPHTIFGDRFTLRIKSEWKKRISFV